MLVLTRKNGESFVIGGVITVTVLQIDRGKVRIGVEAPKEINIARSELLSQRGDQGDSPPQENKQ